MTSRHGAPGGRVLHKRRRKYSTPENSQFNTDRSSPGRWTITFSNPPINILVATTIVELGALMTDLEADPSVKVVVSSRRILIFSPARYDHPELQRQLSF